MEVLEKVAQRMCLELEQEGRGKLVRRVFTLVCPWRSRDWQVESSACAQGVVCQVRVADGIGVPNGSLASRYG